jgi:uncharacterized GH25 family protein
MDKKIISILLFMICGTLALAHEFWLIPKKFRFAIGEEMPISFMVGENFEGEPWNLTKHKAEKLELHQLTKSKDLHPNLEPDAKQLCVYRIRWQKI